LCNLGYRVVTVSRSAEKTTARCDRILSSPTGSMVTDRDIDCVGYGIEPPRKEWQSDRVSDTWSVRIEDGERLGDMPLRDGGAFQLVLKTFERLAEMNPGEDG
jgi:hypothetical protein